jgi:hypothetical protein
LFLRSLEHRRGIYLWRLWCARRLDEVNHIHQEELSLSIKNYPSALTHYSTDPECYSTGICTQHVPFALPHCSQHLVSSSQPPTYIDQCRSRANMRKRPRYSNIADIRWIMYHQLRDNMESKKIHHLSVRRRDDLCQGSR